MPLNTLFVRDFALVRRLDLELTTGLTVLTGETGAGKSILVDALALALGARGETDAIRHGADNAEVLAGFDLDPAADAAAWLREQELLDGDTCITRRIIYRDKPTKAFINGRPVTVQILKGLGDLLVDIHGQHEHQSLLRRESQRQVLDDYAGIHSELTELEQVYESYQRLRTRYASLSQESDDRTARIDLLRYQKDELEQLGLTPGEYRELEQEHSRLAHASELTEGMQYAVQALYEADDNAVNHLIAECIRRLDALAAYAPDINEESSLLNDALMLVEEAAGQLNHKLGRVELDPKRLTWVEQRIKTLLDLARKHACTPDRLGEVLAGMVAELSDLEDADTNLEQLEQQITQTRERYRELAGTVSAARADAGERLSAAVSEQMQGLGMQGGRFNIDVATEEGEPTRYGFDRVEFRVSANPGQPAKPMTKVASGGELSRISLAIQVVIAAVGRVPSLIFDEVDVGIGGGVAEIVGQKLRALGDSRQVLCITHLPQVAAQGGSHLRVHKQEDQGVFVAISHLDPALRIDEVARMLGGVDITEQTRAHAEDMLSRVLRQNAATG